MLIGCPSVKGSKGGDGLGVDGKKKNSPLSRGRGVASGSRGVFILRLFSGDETHLSTPLKRGIALCPRFSPRKQKTSLRGTKQSRTVQGEPAYRGLLRASQ